MSTILCAFAGVWTGSAAVATTVTITPASAVVAPSRTQQFAATVSGLVKDRRVTWSVNGVTGGNSVVGTISSAGLYTAPVTVTTTLAAKVMATSVADGTKSPEATVTVYPPVSVSVTPSSALVAAAQTQQLSASVAGGSKSLGVSWSVNGVAGGNDTVGRVSTSGLYSAPAVVSTPSTISVSAASLEDPTKSAAAGINLSPSVTVTVSPATSNLEAGQTKQFSASVSGSSNTSVTWKLSAAVGSISATGLYTAPSTSKSIQTVNVIATSVADPNKSAQGTVTIGAPISVTITPSAATVGQGQSRQFAATVSGSSNTAVTWSLSSAVGTISSAGLYTAPASVSSSQTVSVIATSAADPTKKSQATVTVASGVSVSVTPATATVRVGQTQQFSASVTGGSQNSGVTWSVNGVAGGNSTVGMVSATGLYTAPPAVPTGGVTVTASSVENPATAASASVTVASAMTVSITPATASLSAGRTQQFTASVAGATNTGVTWSVSPAVGTVSPNGLYSAPSSVASQTVVSVTATSVEDTRKSATATVTLNPAVTLSIAPASVNLLAGGSQQFTATANGSSASVTWSLSAPVGAISSSGLYSAPASVSAAQTVTVIATSVADPTRTAQAVVGISPNTISLAGGLVSYPTALTGPNQVLNSGFEGGLTNWVPQPGSAFAVDNAVTHSGAASLRLSSANLATYVPSTIQNLQLKAGVYTFGGWLKMSGIAATSRAGSGIRICLFAPAASPYLASACTAVVKGTTDWQYYEATNIVVPQDTPAQLVMDAYAKPDGTAWFDDMTVTRAQLPLQSYMLYPNYRGLLFDDQSQLARFNISIDPPGGAPATDFVLNGKVTDETSGAVVLENSFPTAASLSASFNMSGLLVGRSYLVQFRMSKADGSQAYTYPAYRIVKVSGALRASLTVSFDEQNRFLLRGKPSFLLGVYDSGLDITTGETAWENQFTTARRLWELPINFYLNYMFGAAQNATMGPMMNVLQRHGIYNLTNANCFQTVTMEQQTSPFWFLGNSDAVVQERAQHPAFAGFYSADECYPNLVPNVFGHYQRMKALNPGGITFSALLPNANVSLWRDAVDVLSIDPYPIYGPEPAGGYPFTKVADGAVEMQKTVMGSRPFVMVLQFFQFTAAGRWPTQAELRSMSYGAITGGANGLFYWSLGVNALAWICDGRDAYRSPSGSASWCQARVDNFNNLKNVITEMKSLEPVLTLPDRSDLLVSNSNSTIRTRVKYDGTTAYLIAYNNSNSTQSATLQWRSGLSSVTVPEEGRTVPAAGQSFGDSFGPYAARVYVIR